MTEGLITTGPKAGRMRCVVMGCGRTFKHDGESAIMCGKHYKMADRWPRRARAALKRKGTRRGWSDRMMAIDNRLWDKIVQQATERTLGL